MGRAGFTKCGTSEQQSFGVLNHSNVADSDSISDEWLKLLSYLSQEAVGKDAATLNATGALDNALLPVLEDQLRTQIPSVVTENHPITEVLKSVGSGRLKLEKSVSRASLNSFYLVEDFIAGQTLNYNGRGVISVIKPKNPNFIDEQFGNSWPNILYSEFIISTENSVHNLKLTERVTPCLISISAECDEVQERYLAIDTF